MRAILVSVCCSCLVAFMASECAANPSVAVQIGTTPAYGYPFGSADEFAVTSESPRYVLSVRAAVDFARRWEVIAGLQHWTSEGLVGLPQIPELPMRSVDTRVMPLYAGVRFQPGPLDRPIRLYLDLAPGIAVLHTDVTVDAPSFAHRSATYLAPAVVMGAAIDVPFSSRAGLQLSFTYLLTSGFDNSEELILNEDFAGIREFVVLGGLRLDLF